MEALESTPDVRARMSRQKSKDTKIEVALRKALHASGLRFRVHGRPVKGVRREADIVFGPARVAVFVDGCFWHGCPEHATWPRRNAEFWRAKIEGNQARDRDTDARLAEAGWLAFRVWEHEPPAESAVRVAEVVARRRAERAARAAARTAARAVVAGTAAADARTVAGEAPAVAGEAPASAGDVRVEEGGAAGSPAG
ncbi:very short patch repair endonuclease [Streptomyces sp. NBC_00513]|uniref:very short patch repair endonuclease n=1 Tax=unclassified Streptomyces TaxID=2593676 RepID=UPI00224E1CCA|nr:very short patch repair endonuclease [Streptomyces sp. NBC_00424]MCX5075220.1 very short patch repair endonuclease [Streptomyces sp. NBC_00424]WUD41648.1 very short patch repair endonuclease [Streptomyces sp. NBC_00513]